MRDLLTGTVLAILIAWLSYGTYKNRALANDQPRKARIVIVAQSPPADFVGADSAVLQTAADSLQPGDTLEIGPGTYAMDNSLFVPSRVTVRGQPGQTILRKSAGVESVLVEDGDYGERQLRAANPEKFRPGMGISVSDHVHKADWDVSVATVKSIDNRLLLRIEPMLLQDYNAEEHHASIHNSFPILCANQTEGVVIENLTVDGNKTENAYMDGCRGGAIYLYHTNNAIVRNCVARNYNGDGISFQITDNVRLINCESRDNTGYGVHPGAGTTHCTVKGCRIHDNGQVGLFLCWRVQNGRIEDNSIENNGQHGISIGHKDTDNVFVNNTIAGNGISGVYFRKETLNNSGHRNRFVGNKVLNNGSVREGYGFLIEPKAGDIVISRNRVADTRSGKKRTQRYGVYKTAGVGNVVVEGNDIDGNIEQDIFERQ